MLDSPIQKQRLGHIPPHTDRLVASGWGAQGDLEWPETTQLMPMVGTGHGHTPLDLHASMFPTSRIFKELFPGKWLLLKAVLHLPKTPLWWTSSLDCGGKTEQLETELMPELMPTLSQKYQECAPFYLLAASMKYNAINYPDFRFNINL